MILPVDFPAADARPRLQVIRFHGVDARFTDSTLQARDATSIVRVSGNAHFTLLDVASLAAFESREYVDFSTIGHCGRL